MSDETLKVLERIPLFHGLSPETLAAIQVRLVPRQAAAGTLLIRKGEHARGIYILIDGEVAIFRSTWDGREHVLHTEQPPCTIAELPLFDGGPYPASARTTADSRFLFLSAPDCARLRREHPDLAEALLQALGRRLRKLVSTLEVVTLRHVPSRVACALLDFAARAGQARPQGRFQIPMTQTQLAAQLATSRESVARALAALREAGAIEQRGRTVTVRDIGALEAAAEPTSGPVGGRPLGRRSP